MSTNLILVRHGETDWNRELRFQGHIDIPLNDTGHEQARRVGLRLAGEQADHLVCSDLMRCQQTAAPTAQQLSLSPRTTVNLREQHFGTVEGMSAQEIQAQHPRAWEDWLKFQEDLSMPQGESARQFHARVMAELQTIAQTHTGQTVMVFTHGGVLDMVWRTARGLGLNGPRQSVIPNAGINRIRLPDANAPERIEVIDWADTRHLDGLPPQPVYDPKRYLSPSVSSSASTPLAGNPKLA